METTEQKINLQLNIDGYKFFETTHNHLMMTKPIQI